MNDNRSVKKAVLLDCLKKTKPLLLLFVIIEITNLAVFLLYNISTEPFLYTSVLGLVFVLITFVLTYSRQMQSAETRNQLRSSPITEWNNLPDPETLEEEDYQEIIRALGRQTEKLATEFGAEQQDMLDYYTAWVHQIKTPIAVMRLQLSGEDTNQNRALLSELFRIEQYVDMVLQYIRLGSKSTDLVIQEYNLDELIRETIRKYASSFIQKRLSMDFQPTGRKIVTDKKWFCLILEQFLSNAIKYTQTGGISIFLNEEGWLCIKDTGIGIAEEDIPRIFDKGFTGKNGRIGQKSSGLGLYLARRAAELLTIKLKVQSTLGAGSAFCIKLPSVDS